MIKPGPTISVFWFRRDLRLEDNIGLSKALQSGFPVLPIFIFDDNIVDELPEDDSRVSFIYDSLQFLNEEIKKSGNSILVLRGIPQNVLSELLIQYDVKALYFNRDYEPYAQKRDKEVEGIFKTNGIPVYTFKDQVIFEAGQVLKDDRNPYTIFTPYKNKWLKRFKAEGVGHKTFGPSGSFHKHSYSFPVLKSLGFTGSSQKIRDYNLSALDRYSETRNIPAFDSTSYLGPHLRFGTVSIRKIISGLEPSDETFLSELIWREFFMQILFFFPQTVNNNFKSKYDGITWRNDEVEFEKWCNGKTGYPIVDAGMRQLNETGYMHNRVRMVTASFLCKHLLIDWRWGEAYFAEKLLDYELSSNNGNWQWAAGTGCDAAPYFRVFNPYQQQKRFDPEYKYVKMWVKEFELNSYSPPIVEHSAARLRAIETYKKGILQSG